MMEHYRKQGVTVRSENGSLIEIIECGEAWTDSGGVFRARPVAGTGAVKLGPGRVNDCVRQLLAVIPRAVTVERLIVSEGDVAHECDDRRWTERTERVHLSLTRSNRRLQLDLASFDAAEVQPVAAAFASMEESGPDVPSIRLSPLAGALITPLLTELKLAGVSVRQRSGTVDGRGLPIEDVEVDSAPWPNVWRPSYRVPPLSAPMQLVASHPATEIDRDLPCAVALLEPPRDSRLHVLLVQDGRSWPAVILLRSVRSIGGARGWYPVHAGSFGVEMVL